MKAILLTVQSLFTCVCKILQQVLNHTLIHLADYHNSLNSLSLQAPYYTICKYCSKQNNEGHRQS